MNTIILEGNPEESFYKLGLDDRESSKIVLKAVKELLQTPWPLINTAIEEIATNIIKHTIIKNNKNFKFIKSYTEGLAISTEEYAYVMLIPEILSIAGKLIPHISGKLLGCSSYFALNSRNELIHGRLLDFPLHESYDLHERVISYQFKNSKKILGFSSSGIPFSSITLMTDDSITLALHQKFTTDIDYEGIPIFEYINELINNCHDEESIINFVNSHKTMTTWGLNIGLPSNIVLSIDVTPNGAYIERFEVKNGEVLYFANDLINNSKNIIPYGFNDFNFQRKKIAQIKIDSYLKDHSDNIDELNFLELIAKPLNEIHEPFMLDPINSTTLSVMVMNAKNAHALYISSESPKLLRDNVIELKNVFSKITSKKLKIKKASQVSDLQYLGNLALTRAQKAFDKKDAVKIYHELQLAIEYLEDFPEKVVAQFYFLVAQFIYENHPNTLNNIKEQFKELVPSLPSYLADQAKMFVTRIEKFLNQNQSFDPENINNFNLKLIIKNELKIPNLIYRFSIKKIIIPRIDILDVIYLIN